MARYFARLRFFLLLLAFYTPTLALAQRSFFNAAIETGSGSLAQEYFSGQFGFSPASPFYLYAEASHEIFYLAPDDNALRGLLEAGYDSPHWGLSLRGGGLSGPYESLSMEQIGATVSYRFAPWDALSAPVLSVSLDDFPVSSSLSQLGSISPIRFAAELRMELKPFWSFVPSFALYAYGTEPSLNPLAAPSYSSRALRLVRIGPNGFYSGVYGLPASSLQLYNEFKLFPMVQADVAFTRVSLDSPLTTVYSLYLGFDRFFTQNKQWAVSPAYEQCFGGSQAISNFMIAFRYGLLR